MNSQQAYQAQSKLLAAWQNPVPTMKAEKLTKLKYFKKNYEVNKPKENKEPFTERPVVTPKLPQFIDTSHCLAVAKGLLKLILSMDHSGSSDMMLLSFKVGFIGALTGKGTFIYMLKFTFISRSYQG